MKVSRGGKLEIDGSEADAVISDMKKMELEIPGAPDMITIASSICLPGALFLFIFRLTGDPDARLAADESTPNRRYRRHLAFWYHVYGSLPPTRRPRSML